MTVTCNEICTYSEIKCNSQINDLAALSLIEPAPSDARACAALRNEHRALTLIT